MSKKSEQLNNLISGAVHALGFEFVGYEYLPQGRHSLLRVYIDHKDGITLDNCEDVSRQISSIFDVEDPIQNEYTLEVSSPGMDRPIFTLDQMQQFIGHKIKVKAKLAIDGQRNFNAVLKTIHENNLTLVFDNKEVVIDFENVEKANLIPDWE